MDSENEPKMPDANVLKALPRVKKTRKPRPSEIAAKKVKKAAKRTKREKKMAVKRKAKKRPKVVKSKRKPGKVKVKASVVERCERLDLRLSKAEKAKVTVRAKKLKRTLTSIISEAISRLP